MLELKNVAKYVAKKIFFFLIMVFSFLGIFPLLIVIYFKMKVVSSKWFPWNVVSSILLYDLSVDFIYGSILTQHFGGRIYVRS